MNPASVSDRTLLVFVPGLMGTALKSVGIGRRLEPTASWVWSEDVATMFDVLASHPERLVGPLEVGPVLRNVRAFNKPMAPLYGPILEHLEKLVEARPSTELLAFGYDWRQDVRSSAESLATAIAAKKVGSVCFVGHSLGTWVIRALLQQDMDLAAKTRIVVQLAPPMLGASSAFYSLRHSPEMRLIGGLSEWLRSLKGLVSSVPSLDVRLRECMCAFDSMYLLMPPSSQLILANQSGEYFSAFDRKAWPGHYHQKLARAEEVHQQLSEFAFARTVTCYGCDIPTERDYVIDEYYVLTGKRPIWLSGDGVVTEASAVHFTTPEGRRPLRNVLHHAVPYDSAVLSSLAKAIDGVVVS